MSDENDSMENQNGQGSVVGDAAKAVAEKGKEKAKKEIKKKIQKEAAKTAAKTAAKASSMAPLAYVIGYAVAIIAAIIVIVGIIAFILTMPGLVMQKLGEIIKSLVNGWNSWWGEDSATQMEDEDIGGVLDYINNMGYDLNAYGFLSGYRAKEEGYENGVIFENGVITKGISNYVKTYLVSDNYAYTLRNDNKVGQWYEALGSHLAGIFGHNEAGWGKGMINVYWENGLGDRGDYYSPDKWFQTDSIKIDKDKRVLSIQRGWWKDWYEYNLDGWTGKYSMPLEFLISVHLATLMPDLAFDMATSFDTQVNILMHATNAGGQDAAILADYYPNYNDVPGQAQYIKSYNEKTYVTYNEAGERIVEDKTEVDEVTITRRDERFITLNEISDMILANKFENFNSSMSAIEKWSTLFSSNDYLNNTVALNVLHLGINSPEDCIGFTSKYSILDASRCYVKEEEIESNLAYAEDEEEIESNLVYDRLTRAWNWYTKFSSDKDNRVLTKYDKNSFPNYDSYGKDEEDNDIDFGQMYEKYELRTDDRDREAEYNNSTEEEQNRIDKFYAELREFENYYGIYPSKVLSEMKDWFPVSYNMDDENKNYKLQLETGRNFNTGEIYNKDIDLRSIFIIEPNERNQRANKNYISNNKLQWHEVYIPPNAELIETKDLQCNPFDPNSNTEDPGWVVTFYNLTDENEDFYYVGSPITNKWYLYVPKLTTRLYKWKETITDINGQSKEMDVYAKKYTYDIRWNGVLYAGRGYDIINWDQYDHSERNRYGQVIRNDNTFNNNKISYTIKYREKTSDELLKVDSDYYLKDETNTYFIDKYGNKANDPKDYVKNQANLCSQRKNLYKACDKCREYVQNIFDELDECEKNGMDTYQPYIDTVDNHWYRDVYFSSKDNDGYKRNTFQQIDEDYEKETGERWTLYETYDEGEIRVYKKNEFLDDGRREVAFEGKKEDAISEGIDINSNDYEVMDLEGEYKLYQEKIRYEDDDEDDMIENIYLFNGTQDEADLAQIGVSKKPILVTPNGKNDYSWSAYKKAGDVKNYNWEKMYNNREESNEIRRKLYVQEDKSNQIIQIEDGKRTETNPKIKDMFLNRYYFKYDGNPETANKIYAIKAKLYGESYDHDYTLWWETNFNGVKLKENDAFGAAIYARDGYYNLVGLDEKGNKMSKDDFLNRGITFTTFGDKDLAGSTVASIHQVGDESYVNNVSADDGVSVGKMSDFVSRVSLNKDSLGAFSMLENTHTLDADSIYKDFKELIVELGYFTKEELTDSKEVFSWIIPSISSYGWPTRNLDKLENIYGTLIHSKSDYEEGEKETLAKQLEETNENPNTSVDENEEKVRNITVKRFLSTAEKICKKMDEDEFDYCVEKDGECWHRLNYYTRNGMTRRKS